MRLWSLVLLSLWVAGCSSFTPDSSPSAVYSGDLSLVQMACSPVPVKGMDICRFHEGDPITSNWNVYIPWSPDAVSAEVRVKHGDQVKVYNVADFSVEIPWQDFYGAIWDRSSAGLIQALATVKYKDKVVQALGYAFIVMLKPGFDPIPMSSISDVMHSTCTIEYTDKGRSRVLCSAP